MEKGRFYTEANPTDSINAIVINRAVADVLDYEDPVGETFYFNGEQHTIIGILENFNINPLKLAGDKGIFPFTKAGNLAFIKTDGYNPAGLKDFVESVHDKYNPDYPFEFFFLSEYDNYMTRMAENFTNIILIFTFFGIIISYLGLFGLSVFATEQRKKEIGIRKALGSTSSSVLRLIVFDFIRLILLSLVISIPLAILLIRSLLKVFAEAIVPGIGPFLFTSLIVIVVALLTISFQSLKLSWLNPAESLRYE
jgi:putative ABC transport system permease protein